MNNKLIDGTSEIKSIKMSAEEKQHMLENIYNSPISTKNFFSSSYEEVSSRGKQYTKLFYWLKKLLSKPMEGR